LARPAAGDPPIAEEFAMPDKFFAAHANRRRARRYSDSRVHHHFPMMRTGANT
jgi:hypothetical protein